MTKYIDLTQNNSGGGGEITVDSALSNSSENPVQNKVITNKINSLNFIDGGTIVEGLFSDLPTFISELAGKVSNGTITYKITQDETIDATVLADTYGSVAIPVPLWNIPEVVIDGNEKTITITSSNPYVPCVAFAPADFDMATGTLITNYNSKYQVLKIKDLTLIGTPQNGQATLFNSADINLKVENCDITCTTEGSVITCEDGLNEIYTTTIASQGSTVANNRAITSIDMSSVKCYNNTYNNVGTEIYTKAGGRVQANNELYDGITFEGKFSDLPTFFASLDGKSLNGTVTYKITQDETLSTNALDINIPKHYIDTIVIEGNEKTITIPNHSSRIDSIVFKSYENPSSPSTGNTLTHTGQLVVKNLNFTSQDTKNLGLLFTVKTHVIVQSCTFTGASISTQNNSGLRFDGVMQGFAIACEFSNFNICMASLNTITFARGCIFSNSNTACYGYSGGFASLTGTFTSVTTKIAQYQDVTGVLAVTK